MGTALAQNDSVVFPTNTPSGQATGGYFSKYFENIMQRHTTDDGATIQSGPCPADHIIIWFVAPTGNTYAEKVWKGGIPKCKHKDTFNLEASFFKKWSGLQWENRWLPMWAGWAGKEGTLLEKSILFQQKAPNLTLWEDTIEANGGLSVGKMWESTATRAQGPEYGSRLFFEGKDTKYNSDIVAMYRYNRGDDRTDLRMVIWDNPIISGVDHVWWADRFQIGTSNEWTNSGWAERKTNLFTPTFSFLTTGRLGILTERPEYNLHVNGTTKLDGETIVKGPLTVNSGPVTIEKWDLVVKGGELKLPASTYKDGWILVSRGDKVSGETMTEFATNSKDDFTNAIKKLFPDLCVSSGEPSIHIWNVCYGWDTLQKNTTGTGNSAFGIAALNKNTTGSENSAFGYDTLGYNVTWIRNVALGFFAMLRNVTWNNNTAIGYRSLQNLESGDNNVAIGNHAWFTLSNGNNNILIGTLGKSNQSNHAFTESNFLNIGDWIRGKNGDIKIGGDATILENVDLEVTSDDHSELMISAPNNSWYATLWLYRKNGNNHNGWAIANNPGNKGLEFNYDFERGKIGKQVLFLWKDGNVGVGTMNPESTFHVNGNILSKTDASGNVFVHGNTTQWEKGIRLHYNNDPADKSHEHGVLDIRGKLFRIRGLTPDLWGDVGQAGADKIAIDMRTGNVGIGSNFWLTTPPAEKLDVDGQILVRSGYGDKIYIWGDNDGNDVEFSIASWERTQLSFFHRQKNHHLDILARWAHFNGDVRAPAYFYHSDERLKNNISTIEDPKKILLGLRGVRFDWKETGRRTLGLIAQEVEKILPELVHTDEKWYKSVEYANIVAVLIEGFKSQQSEIESLKQQIESQKSDIEFLKQEIEKLKNSQK